MIFGDYGVNEKNEHLKENLIVNAYSADIHKKLYTLPDDETLQSVIATMETMEQSARESKLGEKAMGISVHKLVHLEMAQFSGRRESFFMESDDDYNSVSSAQATRFNSDNSVNQSEPDFQQSISALKAQLAKLKTSVDRKNRTRKKYTYLFNSNPVQPAMQPACPSCRKSGHLRGDRKCPALHLKCHN